MLDVIVKIKLELEFLSAQDASTVGLFQSTLDLGLKFANYLEQCFKSFPDVYAREFPLQKAAARFLEDYFDVTTRMYQH